MSKYSLFHVAMDNLVCTQYCASSQGDVSKAPSLLLLLANTLCSPPERAEPFVQDTVHPVGKSPSKAFSATEEGLLLVPVSKAPIPLTLTITFPPPLILPHSLPLSSCTRLIT